MDDQTFTLQVRVHGIPSYADAEDLYMNILERAQELGATVRGGFAESEADVESEPESEGKDIGA